MVYSGNILFHLNPRFNERSIVLNSMKTDAWCTQERVQDFRFRQETQFHLTLLITEHEVNVSLDHRHLTDFKHRFKNVQSFKFLGVGGDVLISSIRIHMV